MSQNDSIFFRKLTRVCKDYYSQTAIVDNCNIREGLSFNDLLTCIVKKVHKINQEYVVKQGMVLGVVDHKNIASLINIFSVLSLGCVYAPMPNDISKQKKQRLIDHANIQLMLDNEEIIVCNYSQHEPQHTSLIGVAYIMYTSGSTGKPKGVCIKLESLFWLIDSLRKSLPLDGKVIGINGPLSFDTTVKQVFQILYGNTLVLIPESYKLDTEILNKYINDCNIQVLDMTPSLWQAHKLQGSPLEFMLLGGEEISTSLFNHIRSLDTSTRFFNLYGPTETTVDATIYEINNSSIHNSIGFPLNGVAIKIVRGEILIDSPGLFLKYLQDANQTNNSLYHSNNKAWYRTGDKGEIRTINGKKHLFYNGRLDDEIKIRGFRVNLNEISYFASLFDKVVESHAALYKNTICLFYKGHKDIQDSLKIFLKKQLEPYKLPTKYIHVESFPIGKNGKILKNKLVDVHLKKPKKLNAEYLDNQKNMQILQEVLRSVDFSENDSFFSAGGDSISAIMLVNAFKDNGLEITIKDIYNAKTIKECFLKAIPVKSAVLKDYVASNKVFLLPIHRRFFSTIRTDKHYWNQSFLIKLKFAKVDELRLNDSIVELVSTHSIFHLKTTKSRSAVMALEIDNNQNLAQYFYVFQEYSLEIIKNAQESISFSPSKLFTFYYFKKEQLLFAVFHHFLCDGLSIRLMIKKIFEYYEKRVMSAERVSYSQWCEHLEHQKPSLSSWYLSYLQQDQEWSLQGPLLNNAREKHMLSRRYTLSGKLTKTLNLCGCNKIKESMNALLLYPLAVALGQYLNEGRIWVDVESHGRCQSLELDVSGTIGWFTSIYPVLLSCTKQINLADFLELSLHLVNIKPFNTRFGILKYKEQKVPVNQQRDCHSIKFNYLGEYFDNESIEYVPNYEKKDSSSQCESPYPLEIEAYIYQKLLHFEFKFNPSLISQDAVDNLIKSYRTNLLETCNVLNQLSGNVAQVIYPPPSMAIMLNQAVAGAYVEQFLMEFSLDYSLDTIERAWANLINLYESLRVAFFRSSTSELIGVVYEENYCSFIYPNVHSHQELEQLIISDRQIGFTQEELTKSATRFYLFELEGSNYCLWTHHHAILDGISYQLLIEEFSRILLNKKVKNYVAKYSEYTQEVIGRTISQDYFELIKNTIQKKRITASDNNTISHQELWLDVPIKLVEWLKDICTKHKITFNNLMQVVLSYSYKKCNFTETSVCIGNVIAARIASNHDTFSQSSYQQIVGNTLSILPLVINLKSFTFSIESLIQYSQNVRDNSLKLYDLVHFNVEQYFDIQPNETIYDFLFFFDNTLSGHSPEHKNSPILKVTAFEQVHYPLAIIFNDYVSPQIGIEFCTLEYEKGNIKIFLQSIVESMNEVELILSKESS